MRICLHSFFLFWYLYLHSALVVIYCILKMKVDLRHKDESTDVQVTSSKKKEIGPPPVIDVGIDLSEFYMSVEWDILQVKYAFKDNQRIMILN